MKIVHVMKRAAWSGGVESYLLNLLRRARERDENFLIVCAEADPNLAAERGLSVMPELRSQRRGEAIDALSQTKPDIVHFHTFDNLQLLGEALNRYPCVSTTHGYQLLCPAEDFYQERNQEVCDKAACGPSCFAVTLKSKCMSLRPRSAIRQFKRASWGTRNLNKFAAVISPSGRTAERHVRAGLDPRRSHILPYFCPTEPLAGQCGNPIITPQVTFLGRIRAYKGYEYFIKMLGLLDGVKGVMVGDFNGQSREKCLQIAKINDCLDRIELRDWYSRERVPELMSETSVFVFPSIWPETLGIVGLEALSCGVPAVAFDVGGVNEWLLHDVTGRLARMKDVQDLAKQARLIIEDAKDRLRMGQNGIDLVRSRFNPDQHMDRLLAIYSSIG